MVIKLVRHLLDRFGRPAETDNIALVREKQYLKTHGWDENDVESCGQSPLYLDEMVSDRGRKAIRRQRGEE